MTLLLIGITLGIALVLLVQSLIRYQRDKAMQKSSRIALQRIGTRR